MSSKVNVMGCRNEVHILALVALANRTAESCLVTGQYDTKPIPSPLHFAALLPDTYDSEPVPLPYPPRQQRRNRA